MKRSPASLRIEQRHGWIAAGDEFRRASRILSDGAFKLFVPLALEAENRTGRVRATYKRLAAELKTSNRAIVADAAELSAENACNIRPGDNQYCKTVFEVCDSLWPMNGNHPPAWVHPIRMLPKSRSYISRSDAPGSADVRKAQEFQQRGVPLDIFGKALLLGVLNILLNSWKKHTKRCRTLPSRPSKVQPVSEPLARSSKRQGSKAAHRSKRNKVVRIVGSVPLPIF